jgi:uncharacterized protein (TIGR02996 family)
VGVTRKALEAAIRVNRDDGAVYDVYADWLIARGDPFGELIALERRDDPALRARVLELRDELVRWPDGDEIDYAFRNDFTTTWHWGLWEHITIACTSGMTDGQYETPALAEFAFGHPACVALRELEFELYDWRFGYSDTDVPTPLAAADGRAWASELHTLHVGSPDTFSSGEYNSQLGRCSGAISRIFPGLRTLALFAAELELAELELPRLTELQIFSAALTAERLAELCGARVPALERLVLDASGSELAFAELAPIIDGCLFPRLGSLSLRGDGEADELVRSLPGSPLAARLQHLELPLSDDAAIALSAVALPRLRSLSVRGIGEEARARLASRFPYQPSL